MRYMIVILLLAACGREDHRPSPRYWSCERTSECIEGTSCETVLGVGYCTTECQTTADCAQYVWPAVCIENYCMGECWPMDSDVPEDLAFCRQYGFLCPSDCELQGLVCDHLRYTLWPPRYGCVLEKEI